jgi:hypothetical protein
MNDESPFETEVSRRTLIKGAVALAGASAIAPQRAAASADAPETGLMCRV